MLTYRYTASLTCLFLLSGLATSLAQEPKGAATPEDLLEKISEAEFAGNLERQARLSGGPQRPLILKGAATYRAMKTVDDALEDRFGFGAGVLDKYALNPRYERLKVEVKQKKELAPGRL